MTARRPDGPGPDPKRVGQDRTTCGLVLQDRARTTQDQDHWAERLDQIVAECLAKKAAKKAIAEAKQARRAHGLKKRHAAKLARLNKEVAR